MNKTGRILWNSGAFVVGCLCYAVVYKYSNYMYVRQTQVVNQFKEITTYTGSKHIQGIQTPSTSPDIVVPRPDIGMNREKELPVAKLLPQLEHLVLARHNKVLNIDHIENCKPIHVRKHPLPKYLNDTVARLIALPIFQLLTDPGYNVTSFDRHTHKKLGDRMLDFLESLLHTLSHPLISQVHLMYDQDTMPGYISCRVGAHPKLKMIRVESTYNTTKILQFVHEHYQGELVMILNGDVYPGEGFENIDYNLMKSKRLFYSLTRHGRQETRCEVRPGFCDPGVKFMNSHDAYIFVPTEPFPEEGSSMLKQSHWDSFTMELVMMYVYNREAGYQVINPCKSIYIYHNHCSYIRHNPRKRLIEWTRLRTMSAPPTKLLQ